MPDTEKVIKGLELLANWTDGLIFPDKEKWIKPCCERAVALLKEQKEQIKNRDESLEKAWEEIKWLRGMLKEQEEQSVIFDRQCEVEPGRWERKGFCPKCHQIVLWIVNREYCGFCGQKVKWNESD